MLRREIKPPQSYGEADLVTYELTSVECTTNGKEPSNYTKAVNSSRSIIVCRGRYDSFTRIIVGI